MDSSSPNDWEDDRFLLTIAIGLCIHEGCEPKGRPAASEAKKRGNGEPPDGHDPEVSPILRRFSPIR
jgi:hypothetical protein